MFEFPVDAWYVWIGVAIASAAVFGIVSAFPTAPPPDAAGVADTVDEISSGSVPASATHAVAADQIVVQPHSIRLRGEGGSAQATFAFGPVTPATGEPLRTVLEGTPPAEVFESPEAFQQAAVDANLSDSPEWQASDGTIYVRQVHWGSVRVTLVG